MFLTTENILPLRKKAQRGLRPGVQAWPVLCEVKYLSCTTHTHWESSHPLSGEVPAHQGQNPARNQLIRGQGLQGQEVSSM